MTRPGAHAAIASFVLWFAASCAGCQPTTCKDLCGEEYDDCLDGAEAAADEAECASVYEECYSVCEGREN